MRLASFEAVMGALDRAGVRCLVAGGLAVNAHGFVRMSLDLDLVIALDERNIRSAFEALASEGYRPTVPMSADDFVCAKNRERWKVEKGMQVLNFFSNQHLQMPVDIFVCEPFEFDKEYQSALIDELLPGLTVRFVSLNALIDMKSTAGRPKDLVDIEQLRRIKGAIDEGAGDV